LDDRSSGGSVSASEALAGFLYYPRAAGSQCRCWFLERDKIMQQKKTFLFVLSIVPSFLLQIFQLAHAGGFPPAGSNGIVHFVPDEIIVEKYDLCQETEPWEKLTNQNFPLKLIDWQLVINPGPSDKYMDKRIIGTVKNQSQREFSQVKIKFTAYDEEGGQIAIVSSDLCDFKPDVIWKFEIPVTSDVAKAEFDGLYVPLKELKNLRGKAY
jgi:hypothetical protein